MTWYELECHKEAKKKGKKLSKKNSPLFSEREVDRFMMHPSKKGGGEKTQIKFIQGCLIFFVMEVS